MSAQSRSHDFQLLVLCICSPGHEGIGQPTEPSLYLSALNAVSKLKSTVEDSILNVGHYSLVMLVENFSFLDIKKFLVSWRCQNFLVFFDGREVKAMRDELSCLSSGGGVYELILDFEDKGELVLQYLNPPLLKSINDLKPVLSMSVLHNTGQTSRDPHLYEGLDIFLELLVLARDYKLMVLIRESLWRDGRWE